MPSTIFENIDYFGLFVCHSLHPFLRRKIASRHEELEDHAVNKFDSELEPVFSAELYCECESGAVILRSLGTKIKTDHLYITFDGFTVM